MKASNRQGLSRVRQGNSAEPCSLAAHHHGFPATRRLPVRRGLRNFPRPAGKPRLSNRRSLRPAHGSGRVRRDRHDPQGGPLQHGHEVEYALPVRGRTHPDLHHRFGLDDLPRNRRLAAHLPQQDRVGTGVAGHRRAPSQPVRGDGGATTRAISWIPYAARSRRKAPSTAPCAPAARSAGIR